MVRVTLGKSQRLCCPASRVCVVELRTVDGWKILRESDGVWQDIRGLTFARKVVPECVKLIGRTFGVRSLELLLHGSGHANLYLVTAQIACAFNVPRTAVQRLMNVADEMLEPNHIVGFQSLVFPRRDCVAQGSYLRCNIRDWSWGDSGVIRGKSGVDEVPIPMALAITEPDVHLHTATRWRNVRVLQPSMLDAVCPSRRTHKQKQILLILA